MSATELRIRVAEWDDPDFLRVLHLALSQARQADGHTDGAATAHDVQAALRAVGYPHAMVEYQGSADDVLSGVSRWIVRRGPVDVT